MKPSAIRVAHRHLMGSRQASRFHPYHSYTITSEEDELEAGDEVAEEIDSQDDIDSDVLGIHDRHT